MVQGSNPGGGEIFRIRPDRPWGPPSPVQWLPGLFLRVKRPQRGVYHPSQTVPRLKKEYIYTSTPPVLGWPKWHIYDESCFHVTMLRNKPIPEPATSYLFGEAMQCVFCLPPQRPPFDPRPVNVGFVMDKVTMWHVFFRSLQFSPVNVIPSMLHTHLFIYHWRCTLSANHSIVK
jgi:hypothetical protein